MANPRFPHQCVIYRREGATNFASGTVKELYNGPCRKSSSTNIRSFSTGASTTGKVDIADYRVSIPGVVKGIQKGDLVDVTDLISTEKGMRVVMVDSTQLGRYEMAGKNGNRKTVVGGTAVLCNISSN